MSTALLSADAPGRQMKESDWRALLKAIRDRNLVPIIGADLIRADVNGRSVTYDHYIAEELARRQRVTDADLATIGTSVSEATLNDVVSICVRRDGERCRWDLHYEVWQILSDSPITPSPVLQQLAAITDLDLFVSCTCDPLLEQALQNVGSTDIRVYRRTSKEKEDLAKEGAARKGQRSLYYLFGKAEPDTGDYVICDDDLLRFIFKLHDTKYRPKRLFDALRERNLLLLGVNFGDWLARFFLWLAKDRENLNMAEAQTLREYFADEKVGQDRSLVMFLQLFSQSTVVLGEQPGAFVEELHRRWAEQTRQAVPFAAATELKPTSDMPKGALFISYSRPDIAAARNLFAELTRLGIPTWYDAGMKGGDEFDSKLDHNIENCSLFLPLISSGSLEREQGYFRKEWKKAVTRDEKFFGTNKGCIVPIIIDDDTGIMSAPQSYPGMPKRFLELHMYQCPNGKPSPDLIACFRESLNKRPPARSGTNE